MKTTETWTADNGNGTYTNPLFYDEFSDPDMIRVGDDYYLTGTTMHTMPGLPILHSRDLVNWRFVAYACDHLDFGPAFRLEDGKAIYGQGIWAPCFRYHNGTFYIFSNVNGQTTQVFQATDPAGPWTQSQMDVGLHDLSVLFDDDGKIYVVWGYRDLQFAELRADLSGLVPDTQRSLFPPDSLMGEGAHFYKIDGTYYILSAWYAGTMRMPCARADKPEGPYEVNPAISAGEDFGFANGPLHQGGIIPTIQGEWWGYSMMDCNSLGRLTGLSPITWQEGWPYFGLPGNLGRSPRTWVKPNTGQVSPPTAPYRRSDDFNEAVLQPVWQWNHLPDNSKWSLTERLGYLRLHSLPAPDFWWARNSLTQRAIGLHSLVTVVLETSGMQPGDIAGLALLNFPYAGIGVRRVDTGGRIEQFDSGTGETISVPLSAMRIYLRVECDFRTEKARFRYSADGVNFAPLGEEFTMIYQLKTFQGIRYALFHYNTGGVPGGYADFDSLIVEEAQTYGLTKPIPLGQVITLTSVPDGAMLAVDEGKLSVTAATGNAMIQFEVVDRGLGRVALLSDSGFISVTAEGTVTLKSGEPTDAGTFQWMETLDGDLLLLSLVTHRYLQFDSESGAVTADHPGPQVRQRDHCRMRW